MSTGRTLMSDAFEDKPELLEDPDGAPYPEAVQAFVEHQQPNIDADEWRTGLVTALEAVADHWRATGESLESQNATLRTALAEAHDALDAEPEVTETIQWGIAWAEEPSHIAPVPMAYGREYVNRKASREHGDVIHRRVRRVYAEQVGDWEVFDE